MKRFLTPKYLPLLTMGAGGLGFVLRIWYLAARDSKGLLPAFHFADALCYLLFAAALAAIILCVRQLPNSGRYQKLFQGGLIPAVGHWVGAAGILITCITEVASGVPMAAFCLIFGILATASLALIGLQRFRCQRPNTYLYVLLTLYFVAHVLLQVRQWNKETQPSVIFFPLLAALLLMICAYLHAQLTVQQKKQLRRFVFFQQAALLLCCLSIRSDFPVFYLTMAGWLACDLCLPQSAPATGEEG